MAVPTMKKESMNIVFVGHVDHGKSTVIGRLLADTGVLPEGKLEQVRKSCERNSKPFEYAYLIDALKDERSQNITIDAARVFFNSKERHYIIIDAPGHIEFIRNMVTGASRAEAAVLVIDANEGIKENSRRHGYLLSMLGIRQIIVLVNKMDLVDYSKETFLEIKEGYSNFLQNLGVEPIQFIPVSGRKGDNISVNHSENTPWYDGPALLPALDNLEKAQSLSDKPFRMPVQDIYRFTKFGDNRRIVAGTISSGSVSAGQEICFYPSGKTGVIKDIEGFNVDRTTAKSGEAIGFTLKDQIYIQRGQIAARTDEPAPGISSRFRVSLFWLGENPMSIHKEYILKLGTTRVKARIEIIHRIIDAAEHGEQQNKEMIGRNQVAECTLKLSHPVACDLSDTMTDISRFVIVDDYEIWGGGIILKLESDTQSDLLQEGYTRDRKWIQSSVNILQRAERYNQKPTLIIITGPRGAGRKPLADSLEQKLFHDGKFVYYLGIGSVLYGVNADLKRQEHGDNWPEHVRRMAQISHLLLDSGLILILTAIELNQSDIDVFKSLIGEDNLITVWIGKTVTSNISYDLHISELENIENSTVQIKHLLQSRGKIFSV